MKYTAVIQFPEYLAESTGQDSYCTTVDALDPTDAVRQALLRVRDTHTDELQDMDDLFLSALFEGEHPDLSDLVNWKSIYNE